jgi:hypothetical protein
MKPKIRVILEMAIKEGVRLGYSRAHKHEENPTEGEIIEYIEDAVMSQIYEYFTLDLIYEHLIKLENFEEEL